MTRLKFFCKKAMLDIKKMEKLKLKGLNNLYIDHNNFDIHFI